jgi:hypothetical protein
MGLDWWTGFIDHLCTPLGITSNYKLLLISALYKSQQLLLSLFQSAVFTSRSLETASNSGDSSASLSHVVTVRWISRNWTLSPIIFKINPRHGPRRKQPVYCCRDAFTAPLHSNGRSANHIGNTVLLWLCACMLWALPSNARCLQSHWLTKGLFWSLTYWAGIATGYGLDYRGVGVRVPVASRIFSSHCPDWL